MSKRDDILNAAKQLLWEQGYEATSPRDIQQKCGAGQGSFYHHFPSKRDLAAAAMSEVADETIEAFDRDLAGADPVLERIGRILSRKRDPFLGCRVGRMVWDAAIQDEDIRRPLDRYFRHWERRLTEELAAAAASGEVELKLPARQIALMIITVLQGSYTVTRAVQVPRVEEALDSLEATLKLLVVTR